VLKVNGDFFTTQLLPLIQGAMAKLGMEAVVAPEVGQN
jgi:hypothetical protein